MIKRPPLVWIAQGILILLAIPMIWVLMLTFLAGTLLPGMPLVVFLYPSFFICLFLGAAWGMAKRRPYGRWLGVASLLLLLILPFLGRTFEQEDFMFFTLLYSNGFQVIGGDRLEIVMASIFILLSLYLILSKRVTHFFSQTKEEILASRPPLPPPRSVDY